MLENKLGSSEFYQSFLKCFHNWEFFLPRLTDIFYDLYMIFFYRTWLESNPEKFEEWLRNHASTELRQRALKAVTTSTTPTKPHYNFNSTNQLEIWHPPCSSNSNACNLQNVRPSLDFDSMHESDLFMELIRDIANELNIDVLCHKILKNVSLLTNADRGSLFLAKGSPENRYLVSKFFDVRHDTTFEEAVRVARSEEIKIPFGVGIAGTVAKNKIVINIKDAYNVS